MRAMISEDRDSFDSWVIETYRELHSTLFDQDRRFIMRYMLSGEMLCYLLVKPWHKQVMDLVDIRGFVPQEQVEDVRDYLDNPTMDVQAALVQYFVPTPENYGDYMGTELGKVLFGILFNYGFPERLRFIMKKNPEKMGEGAFQETYEKELERLTNVEGFEDLFYYAMDYIDRLIENDEEIPEDMRKLARFLEAQDDYYKW